MARTTITPAAMRDLPALSPGVAKFRIFDSRLRGFIAEQRQSGTTFYLRYKDARGRNRELKIGRLGDLTVEQARKRAEQLKASVSMGADPLAERDKKRAVPLFSEFAAQRFLPHVREHLRSAHNIDACLRLRILPFLGRKALDEINQDDVATLRRRLIDEGLSASSVNRHLGTVRRMFNLALKWPLFEGRNPAASPGMVREVHRDRYLTADQTQALMGALDMERDKGAAAAPALLTVTGARRSEIMLATWDNVDLDRGMLTVPRSKNGRTRHNPLSPFAVAILERQAARRLPGQPARVPELAALRPGDRERARGLGAGQEGGGAAGRSARPRSPPLLRFGIGQCRHAAQRDRDRARPHPAHHHHPLRPPLAAAAHRHGHGRVERLEPAARAGRAGRGVAREAIRHRSIGEGA